MISLELYRARIGGWGGRGRSPLSQCPFRKSPFSVFIDILWRISTRLLATTISALLMIGGVELNPGPGSTTEEEISPMEIEDCSQDVFVLHSQTLKRTPISSQIVPLNDLDLLSQCSSDTPMTPEKSFSTPKSRKRKGYRARNDRNQLLSRRDDLMTPSFVRLRMSLALNVSINTVRILIFLRNTTKINWRTSQRG